MTIGDLVRVKPPGLGGTPMVEKDWTGIITGFRVGDSHQPGPDCRYAIVFWSEQYPNEEEYLTQIEVVSESR